MKFLLALSVKNRLLLTAAVIAVGMLVMLAMKIYYMNHLSDLGNMLRELEQLNTNMLTLRRNEKDFIARKDMKYVERMDKNVNILKTNSKLVDNFFNQQGMDDSALTLFENQVDDYYQKFQQLVALQQEIGLHPKDGLYGGLRSAVHDVEKELEAQNSYELLAAMLQLRRNEKDFMLRLDAKYLDRFNGNIDKFFQSIDSANFSAPVTERLKGSLTSYQVQFRTLIEKQMQIGLTPEDGVMGQMRTAIQQTEGALDTLQKEGRESLLAAQTSANYISISLFISVIVIVLVLVWLTAQSILQPLLKIGGVVKEIRNTNDLAIRIQNEGKDELAELGTFINLLLDSFRDLIINVNEALVTLNQTSSSLAESVDSTSKGMAEQQAESDMVATAATEMQASIEDVAENTTAMANQAEQASDNATRRKEEIDDIVVQINTLSETLDKVAGTVNNLEADSQTIGSVLDVIRGIAEQTNLLALNAAIEAARAGEQGRGFAVVADEVRNLAMRTQESTQEIESIITTLQGRTEEISEQMQTCQSQGGESARKVSEAGESLNEITSDTTKIREMTAQVAVAIEEQSRVASEVNNNVVRIRDIALDASANAKRNAQESEILREQAEVLGKVVSKFRT